LGLTRIRPSCLGSNEWYKQVLPLYQRYQGNVKQRGTVCVSVCLHLNHVVPIVATMFKPFMKEQYYYAPLDEFKSELRRDAKPQDFLNPIRRQQHLHLVNVARKQAEKANSWHPSIIKKIAGPPTAELDTSLLKANVQRLTEAFRFVIDIVSFLDRVCDWKDTKESIIVNVVCVLIVCYFEWTPTFLVLWLLFCFVAACIAGLPTALCCPWTLDCLVRS
jgi:hypothetical protein